jgi:transposase
MSKHQPIHLSAPERDELQHLISAGNAPARVQTRARILLLTDHSLEKHKTTQQIAEMLLCSMATVQNICNRYRAEGLKVALSEKPRPGRVRKLDGYAEAQLLLLACSDAPTGHAQWTLRLLADTLVERKIVDSISHVAVGETLKKMRLSPGK